MLVRAVLLFLIVMGVIAWFGRWRLPGPFRRGRLASGRCRACGAPLAGKGPCPCGKG